MTNSLGVEERERQRRVEKRKKNVKGQLGNEILRDTTVEKSGMIEHVTKRREKGEKSV